VAQIAAIIRALIAVITIRISCWPQSFFPDLRFMRLRRPFRFRRVLDVLMQDVMHIRRKRSLFGVSSPLQCGL